jgi:hypothetical protein
MSAIPLEYSIMSAQPPTATQVKPLISAETGKYSTPVRKELIETAAHDLHWAAKSHARIRLGPLSWYIPTLAILQVLR